MRLEKRHTTSRRAMILAPAGAILFTLIVSALLSHLRRHPRDFFLPPKKGE